MNLLCTVYDMNIVSYLNSFCTILSFLDEDVVDVVEIAAAACWFCCERESTEVVVAESKKISNVVDIPPMILAPKIPRADNSHASFSRHL